MRDKVVSCCNKIKRFWSIAAYQRTGASNIYPTVLAVFFGFSSHCLTLGLLLPHSFSLPLPARHKKNRPFPVSCCCGRTAIHCLSIFTQFSTK
jgi:hypothetical protein